jgi:hypothetical protein
VQQSTAPGSRPEEGRDPTATKRRDNDLTIVRFLIGLTIAITHRHSDNAAEICI